jgi:hypothetical protein
VTGGAGDGGPFRGGMAGFMGFGGGFENGDIGEARQAGISPSRADWQDIHRCEGRRFFTGGGVFRDGCLKG